ARVVLREVLDDDARLGNGPIAGIVAQHGDLAGGPQLPELRAGCLVTEIDDVRLEGRVVLVQRDEHLLTEGREGMKIEPERHALRVSLLEPGLSDRPGLYPRDEPGISKSTRSEERQAPGIPALVRRAGVCGHR